jgi:diguanylate cyclase
MTSPHRLSAPEDAAHVNHWAAQAWAGMKEARILPTPPNFTLWFTYVSGANEDLSHQINSLIDQNITITNGVMDALHAQFSTPKIDIDAVVDGAEEIQLATQSIATNLAANGEHLQSYGNVLSNWTKQLAQDQSFSQILQAITALALETARASERNQMLEQQLSASAVRINRLKENLADVKKEATTDILTGLCNRRLFGVRLRRALLQAKEDGHPAALIMLDIDHFKRINDSYGHHAGDLVLRRVGRLLTESVKGRDTAARYGGEEFAVLLPGANLDTGCRVADQIRTALQSKNIIKKHAADRSGAVTASFGVAQFRPDDTPASVTNRADCALYEAKALGRNRVCTEPTF